MTEKRNAFVYHYARLKDIKLAAEAANIKYGSARNLMTKDDIVAAIKVEEEAIQAASGVTAPQVIKEFARVAFADISLAFDEKGNLKEIHSIPEDVRRAIAGIEIVEEFTGSGENRVFRGYTKKVKFWDKVKALENLGKIIGVYSADNKQKSESIVDFFARLGIE